MKKIIVFVFSCLLLTAAYAEDAAPEKEVDIKDRYYRLYPDFVTNLKSDDKPHYVQVRVEILTAGPDSVKLVQYHEPLIRDRLLMMFHKKVVEDFKKLKRRKAMLKEAQVTMNKLLQKETGQDNVIQRILFTNVLTE